MDEEFVEYYCQNCGREISDKDVVYSTDNRPLCYDCYTHEMYMSGHDEEIYKLYNDELAVIENRSNNKSTAKRHLSIDKNRKPRKPKTRKVVVKDVNTVVAEYLMEMIFLPPLITIVGIILVIFFSLR